MRKVILNICALSQIAKESPDFFSGAERKPFMNVDAKSFLSIVNARSRANSRSNRTSKPLPWLFNFYLEEAQKEEDVQREKEEQREKERQEAQEKVNVQEVVELHQEEDEMQLLRMQLLEREEIAQEILDELAKHQTTDEISETPTEAPKNDNDVHKEDQAELVEWINTTIPSTATPIKSLKDLSSGVALLQLVEVISLSLSC
jgi:hypothetical protein